jgi:hypothetical protein
MLKKTYNGRYIGNKVGNKCKLFLQKRRIFGYDFGFSSTA